MMDLKDAPMATLLVVEEKMGEEVRCMYYVRRDGEPVDGFLPVYGIATTQGGLWRS